MLIDQFGRKLTYLRMAITDRCNLRCHYCMPEKGLNWLPRKDLLTYEEMTVLCEVFADLGVEKIRFTGGEPTLRKGFEAFVQNVFDQQWFQSMHLTTNATNFFGLQAPDGRPLWRSINISLDSLNEANFFTITRRNEWGTVMKNIRHVLNEGTALKINMVVMDGLNDHEILDFVDWTFQEKVDVRFIEEMPFNGGKMIRKLVWNHTKIEEHIRSRIPIEQIPNENSGDTAVQYRAPGMVGSIGIIPAYTRSFCGSCNRLRVTPQGVLLTCLYSDKGLSLRDTLRQGDSKDQIKLKIRDALMHKEINGLVAEQKRATSVEESMALIGG
jgi:molybdenum cofactor biosynthesis protein A